MTTPDGERGSGAGFHSHVPVAGSLSAKIIRACTVHSDCPLECPDRVIEDKGEIASFDNRPLFQRLKEYLPWLH
jgi:hypothetical protein